MGELEERLRQHSACFSSMVNLIPAKIYLVKDAEHAADNKHFHNKKGKAPKQSMKEASKKAKRLKLEPDNQKTIEQLQREEREKDATVEKAEGGDDAMEDTRERFEPCSVEKVQSVGLNELREKLKKRLEGLRKRRKVDEGDDEEGVVDPERAQKRQKRIELRKKKKEKKKNAAKQSNTEKQISQPSRPSVQDQEGRVVYSKFDFSVPMVVKDGKHGPKKNYHSLLKKAEAIQEKLDQLRKEDEQKGQELEDKLKWKRAMQQAKGEKVRDDPKLLKKTLKKTEKKKSQSKKQWEERTRNVQKTKDKRQELRQKHIRERTDQKKTKKTKGRKPGF